MGASNTALSGRQEWVARPSAASSPGATVIATPPEVPLMDLVLSSKDFVLLKQILERYISDLRMEIADTDNSTWRKEMHEDEDRAKQMLARLNAAEPASDDGGEGRQPFAILVEGFVFRLD
ncbi:MAG: hypothetical protein IPI85_09485 [Dehalococcoidia bacterium]|nr:hypothetical protein [Dehalococcoidia bacterium]